jgi:site-specific recombinase XerD
MVELADRTATLAAQALSENTRRAYAADWRHWKLWCDHHGLPSMNAEPAAVGLYVAALADTAAVATIARRLTTIRLAHQRAGCSDPTGDPGVRDVWRGVCRTIGTAPQEKVGLSVPELRQMVAVLPTTAGGCRDGALLLLGFAGGFRRSELVALNVCDLRFESDGVVVRVRRSKTDQEGRGRSVGIALGRHPTTCPVRSLQRWLDRGQISTGPVFRRMFRGDRVGDQRLGSGSVATILKSAAAAAGLEPASVAGHSLRRGFVTTAARAGVPEWRIMRSTGHTSHVTVRRYIEDATALQHAVTPQLGL